jgi:hypothetical protein
VGKLQQDYQRDPDEKPGYSAFWILFPIFLIFGCVFLACACFIYGAGENEGFDNLVERNMSTNKFDEEAPGSEKEETDGDAAVASNDERDSAVASNDEKGVPDDKHAPTVTEQVSEIHDLD